MVHILMKLKFQLLIINSPSVKQIWIFILKNGWKSSFCILFKPNTQHLRFSYTSSNLIIRVRPSRQRWLYQKKMPILLPRASSLLKFSFWKQSRICSLLWHCLLCMKFEVWSIQQCFKNKQCCLHFRLLGTAYVDIITNNTQETTYKSYAKEPSCASYYTSPIIIKTLCDKNFSSNYIHF